MWFSFIDVLHNLTDAFPNVKCSLLVTYVLGLCQADVIHNIRCITRFISCGFWSQRLFTGKIWLRYVIDKCNLEYQMHHRICQMRVFGLKDYLLVKYGPGL